MTLLAELQAARGNPNAQAFLSMLSDAEATNVNGYSTAFGGGKLPSLAAHPLAAAGFTETTGKKNTTTAAGRYQFLAGSWGDAQKALKLKDFGPESQDLAALYLLKRAGGLDAALKGDFTAAVAKAAPVWASLPGSPYPQAKRSAAFIDSSLKKHLGGAPATSVASTTPAAAPPASAGGEIVTMRDAVKDPSAAMGAIFAASAPKVPSYAAELSAIQNPSAGQEPDPSWANDMLASAAQDDAEAARSNAISSFFNEPAVPKLEIPAPIEDSINRYLARL